MITTLENAMLTFMKKLSKEQIEKRNRIKQYLLRSLHIFSYILSALFIIVCIAVGVNSCSNKSKSPSNQSVNSKSLRVNSNLYDSFGNYYEFKYANSGTFTYIQMRDVALSMGHGETSTLNSHIVDTESLNGLYILKDGELIELETIYVDYKSVGQGPYDYLLWQVSFYAPNHSAALEINLNDYNNITYIFRTNFKIIFDDQFDISQYPLFMNTWAYPFCNVRSYKNNMFVFNNVWNYNSLFQYIGTGSDNGVQTISQNINYLRFNDFNGYLSYPINSNTYQLTYELPYFISNDLLFNRIQVDYTALADGEKTQTLNSGLITNHKVNGVNTTLMYNRMYYVNSYTNLKVEVNRHNGALDSTQTYIWYLSTSWADEDYKTLQFLDEFSIYQKTLFGYINNVQNNIGGGSGNLGDVFTLISSAFGGLTGILSISLMPSITLGILLFIPLVVTIIIAVFRLVKK